MSRYFSLLFITVAFWPIPAPAVELTGIALFECDDSGEVVPRHRYNAGPVDAAWDLFVYADDMHGAGERRAAARASHGGHFEPIADHDASL